MKLLIQNKGVAPTEAYTLLGASMSRGDDGLIGQFGSGSKLAICALLRKGLSVTIYCGLTRMEFKTRVVEISDGITSKQERRVYVQYGGTSKRREDLGWVLGFGELDWQNEDMAVREFIANAIDHTIKQGDTVLDAHTDRDLAIEIVDDKQVKAQSGYTRVFIEVNDQIQAYVDDLPRRFLHFTSADLSKRILPKVGNRKKAQIYYNGVFVRELNNSADSICDYNFTGDQIKIDESRNLDEYTVRAAIARLYRDASVVDLVRVFTALDRGVACLETGLDAYYLKNYGYESKIECARRKERWTEAWGKVYGDAVACGSTQGLVGDFARRKGYNLGVIAESSWLDAVKSHGVTSVDNVLDANERKGRRITSPTFEALDAVKTVWGWVEASGLLPEDAKPPMVRGFDEIMDAEIECFGFYDVQTQEVYIRNDLDGQILLETCVEEISHYATGAADGSRDFQSFLIRLLVKWLA